MYLNGADNFVTKTFFFKLVEVFNTPPYSFKIKSMKNESKTLTSEQADELLTTLKTRFEKNMHRHANNNWAQVEERLKSNPEKLWSLSEMERTGGEPDVVGHNPESGEFLFYDCAAESPKARRSLCYDSAALESRKENKPAGNAVDAATEMGISLLTEHQYRILQETGNFDLKTSSWVETPDNVRKLGGAIFCDRRYDRVFTYHNGAESYYAARGFRCSLNV
jgi:hypothetical protein